MKIYYCNINEFFDLAGIEFLSPKRRERVERYRTISSKAESLVAGLLLRKVLGSDYEERLFTNAHGKPQLRDCTNFFNLSHSGNYVLLAVTDCELGIDIEKISSYNPKIIEKCCTADEKEWLTHQSNDDLFYHLWTGKEAVMKATGLGFSMKPESFSLLPISDGPHEIHEQTWYLQWFALDGHQVCTATADAKKLQLIPVKKEELLHSLFAET